MSHARAGLGWALSLLATFGVAALSRADWVPSGSDDGILRVTLTARPERIETCRRLGDAELAGRPAHMRVAVECEGATATYRLRVWRDGTLLDDVVVRGGGFRHDRPIQVLREYPLAPGQRAIRLSLERVESVAPDSATAGAERGLSLDRDTREAEEQERRRLEAIPAIVGIERMVEVGPRQVVLVVWEAVERRLHIR